MCPLPAFAWLKRAALKRERGDTGVLYCDRIVMKSSEQSRKRVAARAPIWNAQEAEIATVTYESYLYTLRNRNRSQKR